MYSGLIFRKAYSYCESVVVIPTETVYSYKSLLMKMISRSVIFVSFVKYTDGLRIFFTTSGSRSILRKPLLVIFEMYKLFILASASFAISIRDNYNRIGVIRGVRFNDEIMLKAVGFINSRVFVWLLMSTYSILSILLVISVFKLSGVDLFNFYPFKSEGNLMVETFECDVNIWRRCVGETVYPNIDDVSLKNSLEECLVKCRKDN